jgi:hypothetical protein
MIMRKRVGSTFEHERGHSSRSAHSGTFLRGNEKSAHRLVFALRTHPNEDAKVLVRVRSEIETITNQLV